MQAAKTRLCLAATGDLFIKFFSFRDARLRQGAAEIDMLRSSVDTHILCAAARSKHVIKAAICIVIAVRMYLAYTTRATTTLATKCSVLVVSCVG